MVECLALAFLAVMVQSEAPHEPFEGKVAAAYVAVNRAERSGRSVQEVVQQPRQFHVDYRARVTEESWLAARTALRKLQPDPTGGADHFYNDSVRPWPAWYDESRVTVKIGRHSFLKLGGF